MVVTHKQKQKGFIMTDTINKMTTPMGFPYILLTRTRCGEGSQRHYIKLDVDRVEELCELTGYSRTKYYSMNHKEAKWTLYGHNLTPQIQALYDQANSEVMHPYFLELPALVRVKDPRADMIKCTEWYNTNNATEVQQAVTSVQNLIKSLDDALPSLIKVVQLDKMATELKDDLLRQNKLIASNALNMVLAGCNGTVEPETVQSVTIDCDVFTALITFK